MTYPYSVQPILKTLKNMHKRGLKLKFETMKHVHGVVIDKSWSPGHIYALGDYDWQDLQHNTIS